MNRLGTNMAAAFGRVNSALFVLESVAGVAVGFGWGIFLVCGLGRGSDDSDDDESASDSSGGSGGKSAGVPSAWTP